MGCLFPGSAYHSSEVFPLSGHPCPSPSVCPSVPPTLLREFLQLPLETTPTELLALLLKPSRTRITPFPPRAWRSLRTPKAEGGWKTLASPVQLDSHCVLSPN